MSLPGTFGVPGTPTGSAGIPLTDGATTHISMCMSNQPVDRRDPPPFPLTTGVAAQFLGTTEPRLAETVRRGRVDPPPPILAGRRLWSAEHLCQAAKALGVPVPDAIARPAEGGVEDSA